MSQNDQEPDFEAALAQLEKLVAEMEEGKLDLAASLDAYEEGVKLGKRCQELLEKAQERVNELTPDEPPEDESPF